MSKRKKSYGDVKPSWVGKTPASIARLAEQMLDPLRKTSVQVRVTDNTRRYRPIGYRRSGDRSQRERAVNKDLAAVHPVGQQIQVSYTTYLGGVGSAQGTIVRIKGGKYYVRVSDVKVLCVLPEDVHGRVMT